MSYDAILFDSDGVLVERPSTSSLLRAAKRTYERYDVEVPSREQLRAVLAGNVERLHALCREHDLDVTDFCLSAAANAYREQKREFEAGVRSAYDDVRALRDLDPSLGVVSDNQPQVLSYVLRTADLTDLFDVVRGCPYTPEEVQRRKPDPALLESAVAELDAEAVAYVGDRHRDVVAAHRAGLDAIYLDRDHHADGLETEDEHPTETPEFRVESLGDLLDLGPVGAADRSV